MRYIFLGLLLIVFFNGCGYKGDPIYIDKSKQEIKK